MSRVDLLPVSPSVLGKLAKRSSQTRVALQSALGVSGPTITRATIELAEIGVLSTSNGLAGRKGRPAEMVNLRDDGLCIIGLSVRADRSSVRLLDARGLAVSSHDLDITQDTPYLAAVAVMGECVLHLANVAAQNFKVLAGVGISFFGSSDYEQGKITEPSTFKAWHHKPLARDLERFTGLPTAIENYSIALVSAVNWFDAKETGDFYLVVADYGIGGVSSIAGTPFLGSDRRPSGFGHIGGRATGTHLCHCGAYDCQMATASVRAIRMRAEQLGLIAPGRGDLGAMVAELDQMDATATGGLLEEAGTRLARNALSLCRGMGFSVCVLGGVLFDHSARARQGARAAFESPGHACSAWFLAEVFSGRETDDLAAAAVAYHHLSQTRKAYLLESQRDVGTVLAGRTRWSP